MKIIFGHPTGNANARAAAAGLSDSGMLHEFITSIASFEGGVLDSLGGFGQLAEIRRRRFDLEIRSKTSVWPWREAGRLLAGKAGCHTLTRHETGLLCIDAVYQSIDRRMAKRLASPQSATGIYAYEDGAMASFTAAKEHGITCLYDLPIGYWRAARRLLESENQRWPEWTSTLTGFRDSGAKLARKDEELRLADQIFVASSFTARTLRDYPGQLAPIQVIPYGFSPPGEARNYGYHGQRPLKLLFVGGLSQRKGIADLFAAVAAIGPAVELTVVGHKATLDCPVLDAALARHHWISSLPHSEILKLMREYDVFVFPSLFEGFGLVITEAMSQGTPVITTDRTAGPDLIDHGRNGWLIEAGSTPALQAAIEELLHRPEQIATAGKEAMETARQRPWEVYGQELAEAVGRVIRDR
ncbi:glycosyltransferase family 4 protein [bacterium]|nr:glycosyltransferase family 4 protein [bacterium]